MEGHDWWSHNGGKLPKGLPAWAYTAYCMWEKSSVWNRRDGLCILRGRNGEGRGGVDDMTCNRCFESCACRGGGGGRKAPKENTVHFGRYLHQKGAIRVGGERQDDEAKEVSLLSAKITPPTSELAANVGCKVMTVTFSDTQAGQRPHTHNTNFFFPHPSKTKT